jgi:hypothetical protein
VACWWFGPGSLGALGPSLCSLVLSSDQSSESEGAGTPSNLTSHFRSLASTPRFAQTRLVRLARSDARYRGGGGWWRARTEGTRARPTRLPPSLSLASTPSNLTRPSLAVLARSFLLWSLAFVRLAVALGPGSSFARTRARPTRPLARFRSLASKGPGSFGPLARATRRTDRS